MKALDLLKKAELFYKQSLYSLAQGMSYTMPDEEEDNEAKEYSGAAPSDPGGILQSLDNLYDITINELLANQLDQLKEVYQTYVSSDFDPENAEALNNVLNRVYKNKYLSLEADNSRWEESYPPIQILDLLGAIRNDATKKMQEFTDDKSVTLEDSNGINEEFQTSGTSPTTNEIYQETGMRTTGDKKVQTNEAIKRWREKMKFVGKVGESHPEYDKFLALRKAQARSYQNVKNDPTKYAKLKSQMSNNAAVFNTAENELNKLMKIYLDNNASISEKKSAEHKIIELQKSRSKKNLDDPWVANNPEVQKVFTMEEIVKKWIKKQENKKMSGKNIAQKIKQKKESGTVEGLLIHLKQRINSKISDTAKTVKNSSEVKQYRNAVKLAKDNLDAGPSPEKEAALKAAVEAEVEAITTNPKMAYVNQAAVNFRKFRETLNTLNNAKVFESSIDDEMKSALQKLHANGNELIVQYGKGNENIVKVIEQILDVVANKVEE